MGVVFARFADEDSVIGLAKNTERNLESSADSGDATVDESPEAALSETNAEVPAEGEAE
jgi:DNA gyrase subunit A